MSKRKRQRTTIHCGSDKERRRTKLRPIGKYYVHGAVDGRGAGFGTSDGVAGDLERSAGRGSNIGGTVAMASIAPTGNRSISGCTG